jgi:hypothetical protein
VNVDRPARGAAAPYLQRDLISAEHPAAVAGEERKQLELLVDTLSPVRVMKTAATSVTVTMPAMSIHTKLTTVF